MSIQKYEIIFYQIISTLVFIVYFFYEYKIFHILVIKFQIISFVGVLPLTESAIDSILYYARNKAQFLIRSDDQMKIFFEKFDGNGQKYDSKHFSQYCCTCFTQFILYPV